MFPLQMLTMKTKIIVNSKKAVNHYEFSKSIIALKGFWQKRHSGMGAFLFIIFRN